MFSAGVIIAIPALILVLTSSIFSLHLSFAGMSISKCAETSAVVAQRVAASTSVIVEDRARGAPGNVLIRT
jgi:hypothetical protein